MHLVEKGNIKLAESIFSSIENCNGVTCNKQFLISYKRTASFKLSNFDAPLSPPPSSSSPVTKLVSSVPASVSFATLHVGLPVMLVLFPINLSMILPTSVMIVLNVQVMSIQVNLFVAVNLCV